MSHESLWNDDWGFIVDALGGPAALDETARKTGAFTRSRAIKTTSDLLRLCFAYGPGGMSLRTTSAWAEAVGLAKLSDVAVMERLQNSGDWLAALIDRALSQDVPRAAMDRPICLVDGSVVRKAGAKKNRGRNGLWRLHAAFDLGSERFDHLELTDERGGERLDRAPVVAAEIRIADRAFMQPDRIAHVLKQDGDVIIRTGWRGARWLDSDGKAIGITAILSAHRKEGVVDMPIGILSKNSGQIAGLRLVAFRKNKEARKASREKAIRDARKGTHEIMPETLVAAEWIVFVTSLDCRKFPADDIAALYRLRWRIELAFKRLKSLIGVKVPPAKNKALARTYLLAHLLLAVLIDLSSPELLDSPP